MEDWHISVEELYENTATIECDCCHRFTFPGDIHLMQTFKEDTPELVLCSRCYHDLLEGED